MFNRSLLFNRLEREAPKFTLWSFEHFLTCVEEKNLLLALNGDSLPKKLISSDFQDGISEILVIVSKCARLADLVRN